AQRQLGDPGRDHRFFAEKSNRNTLWLHVSVSDHPYDATIAQYLDATLKSAQVRAISFFVHQEHFDAASDPQVDYEIRQPRGTDTGYKGRKWCSLPGDHLCHHVERAKVGRCQDDAALLLVQLHDLLPVL